MVRVAIYARVSTIDKGQDTENQLVELRRFAAVRGWEITEYVDHASGKTSDRAAFQKMFQDASRRQIDIVLVWALDRFGREGILATLQHLQKLKSYGTQFESYTEPHFRTTGPMGEMFGELMIALASWAAKSERMRISERTKAGLAVAKAKGRAGGRRWKVFDRERVRKLRKQRPPMSWRRIAEVIKVPESTLRKNCR